MERIKRFLLHVDDPNRSGYVNLLEAHKDRIIKSPGSRKKHHAWPMGYLDHLADAMMVAERMYPLTIERPCTPNFSLGDVVQVLLVHDLEKPWKYVEPKRFFENDEEKLRFILEKIEEFNIQLSENQRNALRYIHGEGSDYSPDRVIQLPLAAFCHICDTASARIWPTKIRSNGH